MNLIVDKRQLQSVYFMLSVFAASAFSSQPVADILSKGRGKSSVSFARQIAIYLANTTFGLNFTEIGELFGRDRTTVTHALRVVEDKRDDAEFEESILRLEAFLKESMVYGSMPFHQLREIISLQPEYAKVYTNVDDVVVAQLDATRHKNALDVNSTEVRLVPEKPQRLKALQITTSV